MISAMKGRLVGCVRDTYGENRAREDVVEVFGVHETEGSTVVSRRMFANACEVSVPVSTQRSAIAAVPWMCNHEEDVRVAHESRVGFYETLAARQTNMLNIRGSL
eukprot:2559660-Rhodomonas_salina.1